MAPTAAARAKANKPAPSPEEAEALVEAAVAESAKPVKTETVQQLKNRLRNEAEREVLNTHKVEVIKLTEAKYDEHGLEYVRRLSDEEKAAKTIEEMYQKFPNLRPVTVVQAESGQGQVFGGSLAAFASEQQAEEPDNYRDVEHREGD